MGTPKNLFPLLTTLFLVGLCSCDAEDVGQPYDQELDAIDEEESIDVLNSGSSENPDPGLGEIDSTEPETADVAADRLEADFNCDNRADLAIGVPFEDIGLVSNAGAVNVIYGSPNVGLTAVNDQILHQANDSVALNTTAETDDHFGWAVAAGDFNNDGCADLAVGAPGDTSFDGVDNAGTVTIFYGSANGLFVGDPQQRWDQGDVVILGAAESGDAFGFALTTGDFGGDAADDLAIGVPYEDIGTEASGVDAGAVNVIYGVSNDGLTSADNQIFFQGAGGGLSFLAEGPQRDDHLGWALAAGDFSDSGDDDLAIGVPGDDVSGEDDAGLVHVIYGDDGLKSTATAGAPAPQIWEQEILEDEPEEGDEFGSALAAGDFDNDDADDLAIGVPLEDVGSLDDAGAVNVVYGVEDDGLTVDDDQYWDQDTEGLRGSADDDDLFGFALAAGNFNGDEGDDLAIGSPGEDLGPDTDAGVITVLYGVQDDGLTEDDDQRWHQDEGNVPGTAEDDDSFGYALSSGDFDGDGEADLAIGIPFENVGNIVDAGAVYVIYGGSGSEGLDDDSDQQLWHQNSVVAGQAIEGEAEANDRFGWSVR